MRKRKLRGFFFFCQYGFLCYNIEALEGDSIEKLEINYELLQGLDSIKTDRSQVYFLPNGKVLKTFTNQRLDEYRIYTGHDMEVKILDSFNRDFSSNIVRPKEVVYSNHKFCGFTMDKVSGKTVDSFFDRGNLFEFANIYHSVEEVVKNEKDIDFIDFAQFNKLFIDSDNGKFKPYFIDYDGLQVGNYTACDFATPKIFDYMFEPKYFRYDGYFTKEMDKKNLIYMFFLGCFDFDCRVIDECDNLEKAAYQLCMTLGIDDDILLDKIIRSFSYDRPNAYLGQDIFRFAYQYDIKPCAGMKMAFKKR